jgi:hypothetical protein
MSSEIKINHTSFGQVSNLADSLIIEISDYLIQFCEIESEPNKPEFICNYPIENILNQTLSEQLISAIKHFQFSKKTYQHIYINYFTPNFTLCPVAFYDIDASRSMLEFNTGPVFDKIVLTDDINADIKLIFSIDESLKSTLDQIYPNHQLKHTLTTLSKLMMVSEDLLKEQVLLSINSNHIEVVVKQEQKLLLANQFSVKTVEDVLYYVLFIFEQYQLNPLTANISVVGNLEANSELITSLKKYIKNIRLPLGNKSINWAGITGAPQHFNYTLINRLFCE